MYAVCVSERGGLRRYQALGVVTPSLIALTALVFAYTYGVEFMPKFHSMRYVILMLDIQSNITFHFDMEYQSKWNFDMNLTPYIIAYIMHSLCHC